MNSNINNFPFPAQDQIQFDGNENYNNIDSNSTVIPVTRVLISTKDNDGTLKTKQAIISFIDKDLSYCLSDSIKNYLKVNPPDVNNAKNNSRLFQVPISISDSIVNHPSSIEPQNNNSDIMSFILNNLDETYLKSYNKMINNNNRYNNPVSKFSQNNLFNNNNGRYNNAKKFGNFLPQQNIDMNMNMMAQNPIYGFNNRMMFNQNPMQQQQQPQIPYNNIISNPLLMPAMQQQQQFPNYNNYLKQNLFASPMQQQQQPLQQNILNPMYNNLNQFQQLQQQQLLGSPMQGIQNPWVNNPQLNMYNSAITPYHQYRQGGSLIF